MADVIGILEAEIEKNDVILLSVSGKVYRETVKGLLEFSKRFEKTCYITLNDPYETVLSRAGGQGASLCFIDCVTSTIKSPPQAEGVIFVSSPRALTEISIALKKAAESFKMQFVIFDSVSALLVYEKSLSAMKFVHNMILTLREGKLKTAFVILREDVSEELMKDLSMFVDKIVEIGDAATPPGSGVQPQQPQPPAEENVPPSS
jgi:hypothetical protein